MATQTHAMRAYSHLRDKLISGDFEPGARLRYGPIGKEIGVSATPVREAAGQLANEGLVELVPQLGAVVRRLGRSELIDIYEVRLAIEPYAARLAAERANAKQLESIAELLQKMRAATERQRKAKSQFADKRIRLLFDKADYQFHMAIIEATGNAAMIRTAGQSHVLTRVFGIRRHHYNAASMHETCDEHEAIFEAIRASRPEQASDRAAEHIRHGLTLSLEAIDDRD